MLAFQVQCSESGQVGADRAAQPDEEQDRRGSFGGRVAHERNAPERHQKPVAPGAVGRRWCMRQAHSVVTAQFSRQPRSAATLRKHEMAYPRWYPVGLGREQGVQDGLTERVTLKVRGVVSGSLCMSVCSALRFISGVSDVVVDRAASEVTLRYDPHRARIEQFRIAVWAMGCRVERLTFPDEHQGWHRLRDGQNAQTAQPSPRHGRRVNWQGGPVLGVLRTRRTRAASTGMASVSRNATSRPSLRRDTHSAFIPPYETARLGGGSDHGSSRIA
jgi:hypothetical protein